MHCFEFSKEHNVAQKNGVVESLVGSSEAVSECASPTNNLNLPGVSGPLNCKIQECIFVFAGQRM